MENEFRLAAGWGDVAKLQGFIAQGVDIDSVHPDFGITALSGAVGANRIDAVRFLLKAKANVNQTIPMRDSPLLRACRQGFIAITELLLQAKADPLQVCKDGWTPLHTAAHLQSTDVLRVLIPHLDTDALNFKMSWGGQLWTPIAIADTWKRRDNVDVLIEAGAKWKYKTGVISDVLDQRRKIKDRILVFCGVLRKRLGIYPDLVTLLARTVWSMRLDK